MPRFAPVKTKVVGIHGADVALLNNAVCNVFFCAVLLLLHIQTL